MSLSQKSLWQKGLCTNIVWYKQRECAGIDHHLICHILKRLRSLSLVSEKKTIPFSIINYHLHVNMNIHTYRFIPCQFIHFHRLEWLELIELWKIDFYGDYVILRSRFMLTKNFIKRGSMNKGNERALVLPKGCKRET